MIFLLRCVAATLDFVFVLTYCGSLGFFLVATEIISSDSAVYRLCAFVFALMYFSLLDSGRCGAGTPGKRILGLDVRMIGSRRSIPLYKSISRSLLKIGIPVILLKLGMDLALFNLYFGVVLMTLAILFIPVSVAVGKGTVGLHDKVFGTYVSRRGTKYFSVRGWPHYLAWITLCTVSPALLAAAPLRSYIRPRPTTLGQLAAALDPSAEVAKQMMTGEGSEEIRPFVKRLLIRGAFAEFPTDYSKTFSKVPPEIISQLQGKVTRATIEIELTKQGFAQHILRQALLDRIVAVIAPQLIGRDDLPTFLWVQFEVTSSFGFVEVTEGNTCMIIARAYPPDRTKMQFNLAEPPEAWFAGGVLTFDGFVITNPGI